MWDEDARGPTVGKRGFGSVNSNICTPQLMAKCKQSSNTRSVMPDAETDPLFIPLLLMTCLKRNFCPPYKHAAALSRLRLFFFSAGVLLRL
jgi:hypothetical protein